MTTPPMTTPDANAHGETRTGVASTGSLVPPAPADQGSAMQRRLVQPRGVAILALAVAVIAAGAAVITANPSPKSDLPLPVKKAAASMISIIAVDFNTIVPQGRLVPAATGSGTIVRPDGTLLTSFHVLYDQSRSRYRDLFIVGLLRPGKAAPAFLCAGVPERGQLDPERDLALVRCHWDMSGRPFTASQWPAAAIGDSSAATRGEPLWLLGFPEANDGTLDIRAGTITGWTSEYGGPGKDFFTTSAIITPGLSGGAALDRRGSVIGVASGFRTRTQITPTRIATEGNIGLVRPLDHLVGLKEQAQ